MRKITQDKLFDILFYQSCNLEFIVGNNYLHMTHLTRDVLVKTIVADEMVGLGGTNYIENLKSSYRRWEHQSSDVLCKKYNQIENTNITVDYLEP